MVLLRGCTGHRAPSHPCGTDTAIGCTRQPLLCSDRNLSTARCASVPRNWKGVTGSCLADNGASLWEASRVTYRYHADDVSAGNHADGWAAVLQYCLLSLRPLPVRPSSTGQQSVSRHSPDPMRWNFRCHKVHLSPEEGYR